MAITLDGSTGISSPGGDTSTSLSTGLLTVTGSTVPANGMYLPTTNTLAWATNSTERMRLDASGNLGLGVTPSSWVGTGNQRAIQISTIGSISSLSNATGNQQLNLGRNAYDFYSAKYLTSDTASAFRMLGDNSFAWYQAASGTAGNAISFTQAMTLDASGNLLVGTTSSTRYQANRSVVMTIPGNGDISVNHSTGNGSGDVYVGFGYNGSGIGSITQNGTTGVLYNTSSDHRLKTNIKPAGSAIESILNFPVDQFDWISTGEHQDFGAVAQKAINFIPEMVSVPADEDEMWSIDWSKAVPRLIKTLQELTARLEALEGAK